MVAYLLSRLKLEVHFEMKSFHALDFYASNMVRSSRGPGRVGKTKPTNASIVPDVNITLLDRHVGQNTTKEMTVGKL